MTARAGTAKGIFLVVTSSLMFASYGVWAKLIGNQFAVFYQGWSRALMITLILLPILLYRKEIVPIARKDWGWMAVFAGFTSLTQAPLFYAFTHMDIGSATLLFFVALLLTMYAIGIVFLGETLTPVKCASFLFAIAGLYLIFSFSLAAFTLLAAFMAMLNGVASGGEVSFSKKLSGHYSALYLTWISWTAIVVTNAPVSFWLHEPQYLPSFETVWLYQGAYVVASIAGFWAIIEGLKYIEASLGGLLGLLEVVFSVMAGIFIFHETLSAKIMAGACLILFAAALPHLYGIGMQERKA